MQGTQLTEDSTVIVTTTRVNTAIEVVRETPTNTQTVTVAQGSVRRRDAEAEPQITERAVHALSTKQRLARAFRQFRRQNAAAASSATGADGNSSLSAAFSSACFCQDNTGPTNTVTYTNAPEVRSISMHIIKPHANIL